MGTPVKISGLPAAGSLGGTEIVPVVQSSTTARTTLQAMGTWILQTFAGFLQTGTGAVARTFQSKNREVLSVLDFGADPTGATDSTAAFHLARDAASAQGGGRVRVPVGTYMISNFTFGSAVSVIFEGEAPGYAYDSDLGSGVKLVCTSGTWAIRIPNTSLYCGLRNLNIQSNGALSGTAPHAIVTAGVEYGVLIEQGSTIMEDVSCIAFQYGCGIANLGNANVFNRCNFAWNTKCGFFTTTGAANTYACYHPNLTPPASLGQSTQFTLRNCNFRRNGWGIIMRDGDPTFDGGVIESNFFGGLLQYVGTLDGAVNGSFVNKVHWENNWAGYDNSNKDYQSTAITPNNLTLDTIGVHIAWTNSATLASDYAGYQVYQMSTTASTTAGPAGVVFRDTIFSVVDPQKVGYLKSCYKTVFYDGSDSGGNVSNWKLGDGTGGWFANYPGFEKFIFGTASPTTWGNSGYYFAIDATNAGIIWQQGTPHKDKNAYTGTITTGDMTVAGITGLITYETDGNSVTLNIPSSFTGTSNATTFRIDGAPASICPASGTRGGLCAVQDNGGTYTIGSFNMNSSGRLSIWILPIQTGAFTASGTKSLGPGCVTYLLN